MRHSSHPVETHLNGERHYAVEELSQEPVVLDRFARIALEVLDLLRRKNFRQPLAFSSVAECDTIAPPRTGG